MLKEVPKIAYNEQGSLEGRTETRAEKENLKIVVLELGCGYSAFQLWSPIITKMLDRELKFTTGGPDLRRGEYDFFDNLFYKNFKEGKVKYIGLDIDGSMIPAQIKLLNKGKLLKKYDGSYDTAKHEKLQPYMTKEKMEFIQAHVNAIPLKNGSVDFVIIRQPQFYVQEAGIQDQIYNVLKPKGQVIVQELDDEKTANHRHGFSTEQYNFKGRMIEPEEGEKVWNYYIYEKL